MLRSDYGDKTAEWPERRVGAAGRRRSTSPTRSTSAPWWKHDAMPQDGQHVYFLSADRQTAHAGRRATCEQPNGIIGTPDGKTLYVADIGAKKTYRFDIAAGRHAREQDAVLRTGVGWHDARRRGQPLPHRQRASWCSTRPAGRSTTSWCPASAGRQTSASAARTASTLFITASTGLYSVRTRVQGANRSKYPRIGSWRSLA